MELFGLYIGLHRTLVEYGDTDTERYIKLANLLDELEFAFEIKLRPDDALDARMDSIFKHLLLIRILMQDQSVVFGVLSYIEEYFRRSVERIDLHIKAVRETLASPDLHEYEHLPQFGCGFNSATIEQMLSPDYGEKLRQCWADWVRISFSYKGKVVHYCFPDP